MIYRSKRESGFNLMELMVTMSVAGILMLIAVPYTMEWRKTGRINSAATEVMYDMLNTQSKSISNNTDIFVTFDTTEQSYKMYLDEVDVSNLIKSVSLASIDSELRFGINSGIGLDGGAVSQPVIMGSTSNPVRCIFKPNGTVVHPGAIYLILSSDVGGELKRQRAIQISTTGRVSRWSFDASAGVIPWTEHLYE